MDLQLTCRSENQGCGCWVNVWDVEGPDEALAALPSSIRDSEEGTTHSHEPIPSSGGVTSPHRQLRFRV